MSTQLPAPPDWHPEIGLDAAASARQALAGPCKAALPHLAVVRVSGADARAFLHGQLSADIKGLAAGQSVLTAWCSAQGRVLFLPRVCAAAGHFDLILARAQLPAFMQRLRLFVLRAAVRIEATDTLVCGLVPADTAGLPAPGTWVESAGVHTLGLASARPRVLVFGERDAVIRHWDACRETGVQPAAWTLLDIGDGIPDFAPELADQLLPQQLNLDAGAGISFTKGCYPGQEVIARLKYRGQVKSRLMRGTLGAGPDIAPGTKLYLPGDDSGTTLGTVIAAAPDAAGGRAVLAVADFERLAAAPAALGGAGGETLRFERAPGWPA